MAFARWQQTIVNGAGDVLPGASIEVRRESVGQPLVSLFSDRNGSSPISNAFTADSEGFAAFHVAGGAYKIVASKGGFSRTWRYVGIGLGQESDGSTTLALGVKFIFDSAAADADPGDGEIRFNHATLSSATAAYIDNSNSSLAPVSAWLDTFDDSGDTANRGTLHVANVLSPGDNFRIYRVMGSVVDGTGYRKLTLVHVAGAGTFAAGDTLALVFSSAGADGEDGEDGADASLTDVKNSIEINAGDAQLVGDELSPGNNKVYGTDGSGAKGWKDDPEGGGASSEEVTAFYSTLALEKVESDGGAIAAGVAGNGVYDGFSALTYVDTAGATNLDTGTAGLLKPALSSGAQAGLDTLSNRNLNTQTTGLTGFNVVAQIPAAQLSRSGTKVRFLIRGPTSGTGVMTGVTFGHKAAAGDAWDTELTPVAVTIGGSPVTSLAVGASTWSDWITFALDETRDVLVKMHVASGGNVRLNNGASAGITYHTKSAASELTTANVTGYATGSDGVLFLVEQIQVASPQDMDVKSSAITLSEAPNWVELYAFVTPNTAALDTDLIFSVARDGSDFQALDMSELYTRLDGTKVYGSGRTTFTEDSGTSGKWRIQTDNDKGPEIRAVGILFGVDA